MQIDVRSVHLDNSEAASQHALEKLEAALDHFAYRIGQVDVRLDDLHGTRHGVERRCYVSVPITGIGSVMIEHVAPDIYKAIDEAAHRAKRAVRRKINRRRTFTHDKAGGHRAIAA